ncbi:MAG: hypothetical protein WBG32_17100 [Nodosilinea sp.]
MFASLVAIEGILLVPIDQTKREKQVALITQSDCFQQIQSELKDFQSELKDFQSGLKDFQSEKLWQ